MPRFPRSSLMLLMLLLCAASPRPLQAADVAFTGVLPIGALYHAPVVSMREARFSNLVRQQTDYSCGAAALKSGRANPACSAAMKAATIFSTLKWPSSGLRTANSPCAVASLNCTPLRLY